MTNTPESGWTDGNGVHHPDSPPPGYWIASDGRWYPAELNPQQAAPAPTPEPIAPAPAATPDPAAAWAAPASGPPPITAPGMAPPGGPGAPAPGFQPFEPSNTGSDGNGNRKLIFAGVAALLAVLVIGGVIAAVSGGDDDGETIAADGGDDSDATDDGTVAAADDTTTTVITEPPVQETAPADGDTTETTAPPAATGELAPASISCERLADSDYVLLDFTNNTGVTSNFSFTVGFFDDAGTRLADESAYFSNVRAGERVIEESYMIEDSGSNCEVLDVDQNDPWYGQEALSDISECTTGEPDFADDVTGTITATNSSTTNADYFIELAIVDGEGIRRGTASAFIETVRPGESAPTDIFTVVDYADDRRCEVIAVNRTESE